MMDFDHILSSFASQLAPQQKEATIEGFGTKGQWEYQIELEYQEELQYSPNLSRLYHYVYAPSPSYTIVIESPYAVAESSSRPDINIPSTVSPTSSQTQSASQAQSAEQGMTESDKSLMYVAIAVVLGGLALMFLK